MMVALLYISLIFSALLSAVCIADDWVTYYKWSDHCVTLLEDCSNDCNRMPDQGVNEFCEYNNWGACGFLNLGKHCECKCSYNRDLTQAPHMLYRDDARCGASYPSIDYPSQDAICNQDTGSRCCSNLEYCGDTSAHCECDGCLDWGQVSGQCVLEEITLPVDLCTATAIDMIDERVDEQIAWDVAGALLGGIPLVGFVFDVVFAVMDPIVNPTAASLVNDLASAVNDQFASLQQCMNDQITNLRTDIITGEFKQIIDKSQQCHAYSTLAATDDCVTALFFDFSAMMPYWRDFASGTSGTAFDVALAYQNMLPIFQAIVPLFYAALSHKADIQLRNFKAASNQNTACDFNSDINNGRQDVDYALKFIAEARDAVMADLTPSNAYDVSTCEETASGDKDWIGYSSFRTGDQLNATQYWRTWLFMGQCTGTTGSEMQYMDCSLQMTNSRTCNFKLKGDWICDQSMDYKCTMMRDRARKFVTTLNSRLEGEWKPAFVRKYMRNLLRYKQSLESIPWLMDVTKCDFTPYTPVSMSSYGISALDMLSFSQGPSAAAQKRRPFNNDMNFHGQARNSNRIGDRFSTVAAALVGGGYAFGLISVCLVACAIACVRRNCPGRARGGVPPASNKQYSFSHVTNEEDNENENENELGNEKEAQLNNLERDESPI